MKKGWSVKGILRLERGGVEKESILFGCEEFAVKELLKESPLFVFQAVICRFLASGRAFRFCKIGEGNEARSAWQWVGG